MNEQSFSLEPFPTASPKLDLTIAGNIARHSNTLAIGYTLTGEVGEIGIPPLADMPIRKNGLWEETCFEFFLGVKNSPRYWEFNLSPAGHWAVYSFADYRQGMQEEMAFTSLSFTVQKEGDSLSLALELDLEKIVQATQALLVGISAVIKHKDGDVTYWALTHAGSQADFHLRDTFRVEL